VLVAESASEVSPADKDNQGLRGFAQRHIMKSVGAAMGPAPTGSSCCAYSDGDGVAESRMLFAQGLH